MAAPAVAPIDTPLPAIPITQVPGQQRKKRARQEKKMDFLGTNDKEPVKEVLEALPPKTTVVALVHNKY